MFQCLETPALYTYDCLYIVLQLAISNVLVGKLVAYQINSTTMIIIIDPYFIPITDFMKCGGVTHCLLLCFLHATPEWCKNGKVSIVTLDNVELLRYVITLNGPLLEVSPSSCSASRVETTVTSTITTMVSTTSPPNVSGDNSLIHNSGMILLMTAAIPCGLVAYTLYYLCKNRLCIMVAMNYTDATMYIASRKLAIHSGSCMEREVLKTFYHDLVCILPVESILFKLIPQRIITTDDIEKIKHIYILPKEKASYILNIIDRSLEAGVTDSFYILLDLMEEHDNVDVKGLVKDIRRTLMTVLILSCPHCDQLCNDIKRYGYAVRKTPIEANSTSSYLKTSLDHFFPLIICSCLKCKVPIEVQDTSTRNVLQLHHTGNERPYMDEVLKWLDTKLPRRNSVHTQKFPASSYRSE